MAKQIVDPSGVDPGRAEAIARLAVLAQFGSGGQPIVPASWLGRPATTQLLAALAGVRRYYSDLISPPSLDTPGVEVVWCSGLGAGVEPDWQGLDASPAANALLLGRRAAPPAQRDRKSVV